MNSSLFVNISTSRKTRGGGDPPGLHNTLSAGAVCFLALSVLVSPARARVDIVEDSPQRLVLSWEMEGFAARTEVGQTGDKYTHLDFSGSNVRVGSRGEASLPGFAFFVGVPASGGVRIRMHSREIRRVAPSAPLERVPGDDLASDPHFEQPWISTPSYAVFRRLRAARVVIRPVVYDSRSNEIRYLRRGSCTIEFPAGSSTGSGAAGRGDYDSFVRSLIVNYATARRWTMPPSPGLRKRAAAAFPLSADRMVHFTVGDGHAGLNEGTTEENGVLKITGGDIASHWSGTIPVRSVALYASHKGELPERVPKPEEIPDGVVEVPLVRVDRNGNKRVDSQDYFLACVTGASDWIASRRDGGVYSYSFQLNRYDDYRHYWLVVKQDGGAQSAGTFEGRGAGKDTIDSFESFVMLKKSTQLPEHTEGGIDWTWQQLNAASPVFDFQFSLPGLVSGQGGRLRVHEVRGHSKSLWVTLGGEEVCGGCMSGDWREGGVWAEEASLRIDSRISGGDRGFDLGAVEVVYPRRLDLDGIDRLMVYSPSDSGLVTYRLAGLDEDSVHILRVSAGESDIQRVVPSYDFSDNVCTWTDTAGIGIRYFVSREKGLRSLPVSAEVVTGRENSSPAVRNLRRGARANYVIITPAAFEEEAVRLAEHKKRHGTFTSPAPRVIAIEDIYREFSGGAVDPTAIRNFLFYVDRYWSGTLDYVLLLGDGHYDYKQITTREAIRIPTAQKGEGKSQKCVEDYFACLTPDSLWSDDRPDVMLGRIPCRDADEAAAVVDKIIDTEAPSRADYGAWRSRILFVADDDRQGPDADPIVGTSAHHVSSERVAEVVFREAPLIDVRKVYLFEYEFDEVYFKPGASRAIENHFNNGISFVNYFGHGSDVVWADEHVLQADNLSNLQNERRYPVVSSFSCSVGRFDRPDHTCLTGELVRLPAAGAVAGIAATRVAYASSNTTLAIDFYETLFDLDSIPSVGGAYRRAMAINSRNKQYAFLGDPSLRYLNPRYEVDLSIADENGKELDTLKALQEVCVEGRVVPSGGTRTRTDFGSSGRQAYVHVGLFNPADTSRRKDGYPADVQPYTLPGTPIFMGKTAVEKGRFEQRILLPRNLFFEREGVRLTAYAWEGERQALGYNGNVIFKGTVLADIQDTTGPRIAVRPLYQVPERNSGAGFTDRIVLSLPADLEVELSDSSGLDVVGTTPDAGVAVAIPGAMRKQNMNHKFQFAEGDYRRGVAVLSFEEGSLNNGAHDLVVAAQDLFGNSSIDTVELEVTAREEFKLGHVFNYPNPMRVGERTRFFFYSSPALQYTRLDTIAATIRIYTLSGKLVRVIDPFTEGTGSGAANGVAWDGTDQLDNLLPPDIYLYQVTIEDPGSVPRRIDRSPIRKLVIHPPRRGR